MLHACMKAPLVRRGRDLFCFFQGTIISESVEDAVVPTAALARETAASWPAVGSVVVAAAHRNGAIICPHAKQGESYRAPAYGVPAKQP